jgi:hypothetical protein
VGGCIGVYEFDRSLDPSLSLIEEHRTTLATQAQAQAQAAARATAAAPRKSKELPQRPEVTAADLAPPAIPEKFAHPAPAPFMRARHAKRNQVSPLSIATPPSPRTITILGEDDDWDLVEGGVMKDKNGARGTSLFARGVVDRYKLTVFKKPFATPATRRVKPRFYMRPSDALSPIHSNPATSSFSISIRSCSLAHRSTIYIIPIALIQLLVS